MAFTNTTVNVGPDSPSSIVGESDAGNDGLYAIANNGTLNVYQDGNTTFVTNPGLVRVWLGDNNVTIGTGTALEPGAPPFVFAQ